MGSRIESSEIEEFLAAHKPVSTGGSVAPGEVFDDWRVTAFLGRGGSGEVYRVVHTTLGTAAALKVCVKNPERDASRDEAVCARFRREAKLLAENKHPAFPCFLGFGEREDRPWYVMELLEYRPLPTTEREIVRFLLAVASGVQHLHSQGIIHRDIKPGNILWRNSVPVLIDLGLAKDMSAVRGHAGESLSIVDGKAMGVGTPRYAAPEQMSGEAVSPATDVYALGILANDCFGGKPPRAWRRIIQRATAAVPAQRYATAEAFARAIKLLQMRYWMGGALIVVLVAAVVAIWALSPSAIVAMSPTAGTPSEKLSWQALCRNFTTNIVTKE